jgi:hypothetical protein
MEVAAQAGNDVQNNPDYSEKEILVALKQLFVDVVKDFYTEKEKQEAARREVEEASNQLTHH